MYVLGGSERWPKACTGGKRGSKLQWCVSIRGANGEAITMPLVQCTEMALGWATMNVRQGRNLRGDE